MFSLIIAAVGSAFLVIICEALWRKKIIRGEIARKAIHILVACYAAFWPFFMQRYQIFVLSIFIIIALILVKRLKIFKIYKGVDRAGYGEIWYAISIGTLALVFKNDYIYMIAVLHIALADSFAAIVGKHLAKKAKNFNFQGSRKSLAGTATFILVSFILNLVYWMLVSRISLHGSLLGLSPIFYSLLSAILLGCIEIMAPKGSDNIVVPFAAGVLLWLPAAIFV